VQIPFFNKIIISYSILLLLTLFIGVYTLHESEKTVEQYSHLLIENGRLINEVRTVQVEFKTQVQEWKNILIRGHNPTDLESYSVNFIKQYGIVREHTFDIQKFPLSAKSQEILKQFLEMHRALYKKYVIALKIFHDSKNQDYKSADKFIRGEDRILSNLIDELVETILAEINQRNMQIYDNARVSQTASIIVLAVTLLVATLLSFWLARLFSKPNEVALKLSKYLSPQIYASIFSGENDVRIGTSRKELTIFFSDIQGFTELTERLESEVLASLLNDYLNDMAKIALEHGGTIDKFMGDGIMIFFGDPKTSGNRADALACIKMAVRMRKRLKVIREKWRENGVTQSLYVRMGINTGFCTVGNFGSEDRLDYTIVGKEVNLASRLETYAKANQILISPSTYVLVSDEFFCEEQDEIKVKGIAYPVKTYQVIDLKNEITKNQIELQKKFNTILDSVDYENVSAAAKMKLLESLQTALLKIE
jgi:class 3 adenylate cyclase/CHASE3 domain sensor protein